MSVDDFKLPYPYPKLEVAEGLQLDCVDTGLPHASRIGLLETNEKGVYVLRVELFDESRNGAGEAQLDWLTYFTDLILEFFGLPEAWDWQEREEQYPEELPIMTFETDEGHAGLKFWITREEFEQVFVQIASSDYVQLMPEVGLVYATREESAKKLAWAQDVFRRLYPTIHDYAVEVPEVIELRALLNRKLEVEAYGEPDLRHCLSLEFMRSEKARYGFVPMGWGQWDGGVRIPKPRRRRG